MTESLQQPVSSSFRDPSGHIFKRGDMYYRQINESYKEHYDQLMMSGLYEALVAQKLLLPHEEVEQATKTAYRVILPTQLPYTSYPYEWSFSQLKDAALTTLEIQKIALQYGMSLKDASAYNIQFLAGQPLLIDTLSFEIYQESKPWVAYKQFCQHFLAPLALMSYTDIRLGTLTHTYLDGLPLDLVAKLLPGSTRFWVGLQMHLHLHAKSQQNHADSGPKTATLKLPKEHLIAIVANLASTVEKLKLPKQKTVWDDYYDNTNYSESGFTSKKMTITGWLDRIKPKSLWDAGANNATFSRLGSSKGIFTLATDIDPMAVEQAYLTQKKERDEFLLPLIVDLTNPSPAIGWMNQERNSLLDRNSFDLTFALALIHHLAIANNVPLSKIAEMFSQSTKQLIIEFVPKEDSNTKRLLANREDIFPDYTQEGFEKAFTTYFSITEKAAVEGSSRTLYLLTKK